MARTRQERRTKDFEKAIRKMKICKGNYGFEWYDNLHQYSKNKIHCSCPLCSAKTNGISIYIGTYGRNGKNYTIKDLKRIEEMKSEMEEVFENCA